jgi:hypothetical protein
LLAGALLLLLAPLLLALPAAAHGRYVKPHGTQLVGHATGEGVLVWVIVPVFIWQLALIG